MITGMAVATPTLVYVWPKTKAEFDKIMIEPHEHDWKEDTTTTIIKRDGQQWESRCTSKSTGTNKAGAVMVVFQWWDYRPIETELCA